MIPPLTTGGCSAAQRRKGKLAQRCSRNRGECRLLCRSRAARRVGAGEAPCSSRAGSAAAAAAVAAWGAVHGHAAIGGSAPGPSCSQEAAAGHRWIGRVGAELARRERARLPLCCAPQTSLFAPLLAPFPNCSAAFGVRRHATGAAGGGRGPEGNFVRYGEVCVGASARLQGSPQGKQPLLDGAAWHTMCSSMHARMHAAHMRARHNYFERRCAHMPARPASGNTYRLRRAFQVMVWPDAAGAAHPAPCMRSEKCQCVWWGCLHAVN